MQYRTLGTTGLEVSALGFGAMRLPIIAGGTPNQIDRAKAAEVLHHAIDSGVNYVDTAWFYHAETFGDAGESEVFVGEALSGGWRDKVLLATKLPVMILRDAAQMPRFLHDQLERLQTPYLDFYLMHGLNGAAWDKLESFGVLEFIEKAKERGLIRHAAFSFHGEVADFKRIVDAYDWAFAQIQYNYMDVDYQAGYEGLRYAADKGMGVVVMEPLKGGKLAKSMPDDVIRRFHKERSSWTPVEWALRYVWDDPGVSMLLSGMNEIAQVDENVRIANEALPGSLNTDDVMAYRDVRAIMAARVKADCTACRYCMPCPQGVDIPGVIKALNAATLWGDPNQWLSGYARVEGKASLCTSCGQCEQVCPQSLPIPELMLEAKRTFGE